MILLILACAGTDPVEPPTDREVAEAAAVSATADRPPTAPPSDADALVTVEITWSGVGDLYRRFFQDQAALTELSRRLAPHIKAPAQLKIWYDSENFVGGIRLVVPPGGWLAPIRAGGGAVDLQALSPVTEALAIYRDAIAASYDLRVQSLFSVGIDLFRGAQLCEIEPTGDPPPDGRTVSPCPTLNGAEFCGLTGADGVRFSEADWEKIAPCFQD